MLTLEFRYFLQKRLLPYTLLRHSKSPLQLSLEWLPRIVAATFATSEYRQIQVKDRSLTIGKPACTKRWLRTFEIV